MSLDEFTIISRFFARDTEDQYLKKGIGDDCAILSPPIDEEMLLTIDTLNVDVHFFSNVDPFDLGYKSLAVSLSDIAAMGGDPRWFLISLTIPDAEVSWLKKFAEGLFSLADHFHTKLIGGDTTRGKLSVTTQVIGTAPKGQAILRTGAKEGDDIYVTGQLGGAALAVRALRNEISLTQEELTPLAKKLNQPYPRIEVGRRLRNLATAAIDVSDGLLADLQHILDSSHVGASLDLDSIPLSSALQKNFPLPLAIEFAVTQGDDYELCFTANSHYREEIQKLSSAVNVEIHRIGTVEATLDLKTFYQGQPLLITAKGYRHF